uniref:Uncharacterized protein n=1 Tax=Setaria italica TaxID=4555 RepID=K3YX04_SETIT
MVQARGSMRKQPSDRTTNGAYRGAVLLTAIWHEEVQAHQQLTPNTIQIYKYIPNTPSKIYPSINRYIHSFTIQMKSTSYISTSISWHTAGYKARRTEQLTES